MAAVKGLGFMGCLLGRDISHVFLLLWEIPAPPAQGSTLAVLVEKLGDV